MLRIILLAYLIVSSCLVAASPINPNYCGDNGRLEVKWSLKRINDTNSCYFPSAHCIKEEACPHFAQIPPNYCGDNGKLEVKWSLKKINDTNSCYFPSAHCVNEEACPQF